MSNDTPKYSTMEYAEVLQIMLRMIFKSIQRTTDYGAMPTDKAQGATELLLSVMEHAVENGHKVMENAMAMHRLDVLEGTGTTLKRPGS